MVDSTAAKHITAIIDCLNQSAEYAVLRNYAGLPDVNHNRDIDIIISAKSFQAIRKALVNAIVATGWKILTYLHSDRLVTFVCGIQEENNTELVQWDFFMNASVFGIVLMDADEFLIRRKFNGFLYHVDIEGEFLDKYLYNRAVGYSYPTKYQSIRLQVENEDMVENKLKEVCGVSSLSKCDRLSGKRILVHAMWYNMQKFPIGTIKHLIFFLCTYVRNYICSDTGFSIGFTGPDGAGKTTVINLLIERLSPVFAKAHRYYHFRPELFGNIGDVAYAAGIKKTVDRKYNNPHRGGETGNLNSLFRLFYYATDYILGYLLRVKPTIRITRLAIFDRYYTDIICDSRRSRIFLNYKFLYWFGRLFIPALDYNILLTASVETILSRKDELDPQKINLINEKIDFLSEKKGYSKVLNEKDPDDAVAIILNGIFDCQHNKILNQLRKKE